MGLVKDFPQLVTKAVLTHPHKVAVLLLNCEVQRINGLATAVPPTKLNETLSQILVDVGCDQIRTSLAPLINNAEVSGTLVNVMQVLQPSTTVALVNLGNPKKLAILLRAPSTVLVGLVSGVDSEQLLKVLVPLMDEPESLLQESVLPLLIQVQQPENLAALVNQSEPELLFWFLRGGQPLALAAFLNSCTAADFRPEGAVIALMHELADHRGLVRAKVIPLIDRAEPQKMAQMVQGVRVEQLLEVLQRLPLEELVRLLAHTNAELVVRLFNGPLESTVSAVAGITAQALNHPLVAQNVARVTDNLEVGLQQADMVAARVKAQADDIVDDVKGHADMVVAHVAPVVDNVKAQADKVLDDVKAQRDRVMDDVGKNRRRGKIERGGSDADNYQFGDVARGFVANQVDEVKERGKTLAKLGAQERGDDNEEYKFGDLTRGMAAMARAGVQEALGKHLTSLESGRGLLQGLSFGAPGEPEILDDQQGAVARPAFLPPPLDPAASADQAAELSGQHDGNLPAHIHIDADICHTLHHRPSTEMPSIPPLNIASIQASPQEATSQSMLRVLPAPETSPGDVVCADPPIKGIAQVFQSVAKAAQALTSCDIARDPNTGLPAKEREELNFR